MIILRPDKETRKKMETLDQTIADMPEFELDSEAQLDIYAINAIYAKDKGFQLYIRAMLNAYMNAGAKGELAQLFEVIKLCLHLRLNDFVLREIEVVEEDKE